MKVRFFAAALVATLAACGGGGGGGGVDPSGFWSDADSDGGILVTKSGEVWGVEFTSPNYTLYRGSVSMSGDQASVAATSYQGSTTAQVSLVGRVIPKTSITGTAASGGQTSAFSLQYDPTYEATPSTAAVAGAYTISSGGTVTISASGTFTGATGSGCAVSGTLTPASGENFFRFSISYDAATCGTTTQATGVLAPSASGAYLVGGAISGNLGDAFVLTKQ